MFKSIVCLSLCVGLMSGAGAVYSQETNVLTDPLPAVVVVEKTDAGDYTPLTRLALFRIDTQCHSEPVGALGRQLIQQLFWKPLAIESGEGDACRVKRINSEAICLIPCEQLTNLPTRLFVVPSRTTDGESIDMVSVDCTGEGKSRPFATPNTTPMPPDSIMPYPLVGMDDLGYPVVLGPVTDPELGTKGLGEWSIQSRVLPLDSAWVLMSRDELQTVLLLMGSDGLKGSEAESKSQQFTEKLLCPSSSPLLALVGHVSTARDLSPEGLTRKFKSLERILKSPDGSEWLWIKLDHLP